MNPVFVVEGVEVLLHTLDMVAVALDQFGERIGSLEDQGQSITDALDEFMTRSWGSRCEEPACSAFLGQAVNTAAAQGALRAMSEKNLVWQVAYGDYALEDEPGISTEINNASKRAWPWPSSIYGEQ